MLINCFGCGIKFDLDMSRVAYDYSFKDIYCSSCRTKVKDMRSMRQESLT